MEKQTKLIERINEKVADLKEAQKRLVDVINYKKQPPTIDCDVNRIEVSDEELYYFIGCYFERMNQLLHLLRELDEPNN